MRLLILASLALIACSSAGSGVLREPDEYIGCASDEHWRTFDDQEKFAVVADATAPYLTDPSPNLSFAATQKPIFRWQQSPTSVGMPTGDVPNDAASCPDWNTGGLVNLHLPPITGNVYDMQFSTSGQVVYRVLTTLQAWVAPDTSNTSMIDTWALFSGQSVSLVIYRMELVKNDLRPDTAAGPFVATMPFQFSVGKPAQ